MKCLIHRKARKERWRMRNRGNKQKVCNVPVITLKVNALMILINRQRLPENVNARTHTHTHTRAHSCRVWTWLLLLPTTDPSVFGNNFLKEHTYLTLMTFGSEHMTLASLSRVISSPDHCDGHMNHAVLI